MMVLAAAPRHRVAGSVIAWMAHHAVAGAVKREKPPEPTTVQQAVLTTLRDHGPGTAYQLAERLGVDREVVRNALYRLVALDQVRVLERVPAPNGIARRCVWVLMGRRRRGDW